MKSHIPAVNAPERIEIPHEVDELEFQVNSTLTPSTLKRGRQSRNTNKEKGASTQSTATCTITEVNCRGGSRASVGAAAPAALPRVFLQRVPL